MEQDYTLPQWVEMEAKKRQVPESVVWMERFRQMNDAAMAIRNAGLSAMESQDALRQIIADQNEYIEAMSGEDDEKALIAFLQWRHADLRLEHDGNAWGGDFVIFDKDTKRYTADITFTTKPGGAMPRECATCKPSKEGATIEKKDAATE